MKKLEVVALLLLLADLASGQTRSMCAHQIALVSQACIMIPWRGGGASSSSVITLLEPQRNDEHGGNHHHQNHGHGSRHQHGHGHGHGRGHRHHHGSNAEEECCRWLNQMDSVCVCDLLIRLPRFLTKPNHTIAVTVGNICNATFSCPGL